MEEDQIERELREGREAQMMLESPLLQAFFEHQRSQMLDALDNANVNPETAEEIRKIWQATNRLQKHLTTYLETGKLASLQLEQDSMH